MADDSEDLLWGLILIFLVVTVSVGIKGTNWIPFTSQVTVYRAVCSEKVTNGSCKGDKLPLDRIMFNVSEDKQSVVMSFEYRTQFIVFTKQKLIFPTVQESDPAFERMNGCIVVDRNNSTCTTEGVPEHSMIRGEYKRYPPREYHYYVPKWEWWRLELLRRYDEWLM